MVASGMGDGGTIRWATHFDGPRDWYGNPLWVGLQVQVMKGVHIGCVGNVISLSAKMLKMYVPATKWQISVKQMSVRSLSEDAHN